MSNSDAPCYNRIYLILISSFEKRRGYHLVMVPNFGISV